MSQKSSARQSAQIVPLGLTPDSQKLGGLHRLTSGPRSIGHAYKAGTCDCGGSLQEIAAFYRIPTHFRPPVPKATKLVLFGYDPNSS